MLGVLLSWIFYILSEVSTSCCARWDSLFSLFLLLFHSRWSRSRSWAFFSLHSYPCSHELQTTVDFHCNFGEIVSTSRGPEFHIPSTSCNFWKSSNPISPFPRAIAISHTSTPKSPCSTKSQNKQNLVLMLHFRHLMHAKYSPDPSLVFQKGRVPSLL